MKFILLFVSLLIHSISSFSLTNWWNGTNKTKEIEKIEIPKIIDNYYVLVGSSSLKKQFISSLNNGRYISKTAYRSEYFLCNSVQFQELEEEWDQEIQRNSSEGTDLICITPRTGRRQENDTDIVLGAAMEMTNIELNTTKKARFQFWIHELCYAHKLQDTLDFLIENFGPESIVGAKIIIIGCDYQYLPSSEVNRVHEIANQYNISKPIKWSDEKNFYSDENYLEMLLNRTQDYDVKYLRDKYFKCNTTYCSIMQFYENNEVVVNTAALGAVTIGSFYFGGPLMAAYLAYEGILMTTFLASTVISYSSYMTWITIGGLDQIAQEY